MTDYKQLCAELLKAYEILLGELRFDNRLAKRARTALAEPESEGPTDEELMNLLPLYSYEDGFYDGFFQPKSLPSDWGDEDDYIASPKAILVFARAVLARWGNYPKSPDSSTQPF